MLLLVYEVEEMFTRRYEIRKHDLVLLFLLGLDYVGGLSYFLFSKIAFICVLSGFLLNYYINPENSSEFLRCLAFVLIFMFSAGVLASLGVHEAFLKEFDIKTTY